MAFRAQVPTPLTMTFPVGTLATCSSTQIAESVVVDQVTTPGESLEKTGVTTRSGA